MKKIKLSNRLQIIADNIEKNHIICDIGTDHAFLPTYLITSGKCQKAIACDVIDGPLKKAKSTLVKFGLENKIQLLLSDGFSAIRRDMFDDAVIAGMGGELISKIIDSTLYLKDKDITLYLQPMTKSEKLRKYLFENGFDIINEFIAKDNNKLFEIIIAKYQQSKKHYEPEYVLSKIIKNKQDVNSKLHVEKLIRKHEIIHNGKPDDEKVIQILEYLKCEEK